MLADGLPGGGGDAPEGFEMLQRGLPGRQKLKEDGVFRAHFATTASTPKSSARAMSSLV